MRLRLILPLLLPPLLAACQALSGGDAPPADAQANPITGAEIVVTTLDAPAAPAVAAAVGAVASKATPAAAPLASAEAEPAALSPVPDSMPQSEDPVAAEPVAPVVFKTAAHLACEKRGGRWSVAGGGAAAFCQMPTSDAGKSCRASTDCSGYCLEKSGTCAPVTPMLGCHDILNEQGRMLTQCIN